MQMLNMRSAGSGTFASVPRLARPTRLLPVIETARCAEPHRGTPVSSRRASHSADVTVTEVRSPFVNVTSTSTAPPSETLVHSADRTWPVLTRTDLPLSLTFASMNICASFWRSAVAQDLPTGFDSQGLSRLTDGWHRRAQALGTPWTRTSSWMYPTGCNSVIPSTRRPALARRKLRREFWTLPGRADMYRADELIRGRKPIARLAFRGPAASGRTSSECAARVGGAPEAHHA